MRVDAACANCGEVNTKFLCSGCNLVRYCSKDCQVADWKKKHKKLCVKDLFSVAQTGDVNKMSAVLSAGANANAKMIKNGMTILMTASQEGHPEVVKLLLEKGADVNAKSNTGATALICASQQGNPEVAKLLLEKGAGVV